MNILVGSDYHGSPLLQASALQRFAQAEIDWYVNCGDFCTVAGSKPAAQSEGYDPRGSEEVAHLVAFLEQLDTIGKPWLFVPGNHDPSASFLEPLNARFRYGTVVTTSQLFWLGGFRALIVPWTPPCGWNWMLTQQHLDELLCQYRTSAIDILITHGPPKGALDEEGKWYHRRTPTLRPLVDALKPRYLLCGHMHFDGGKTLVQNGTTFVNAALHNMEVAVKPL